MTLYIAPEHSALLRDKQLDSFDAIWAVQAGWFEPPNERRGGWSGVSRLELQHAESGDALAVFLKRQRNHQRIAWLSPLSGEPTFAREFRMLRYCEAHDIAAPKVVFYAEGNVDGQPCSILMTEELTGFKPLNEVTKALFETNASTSSRKAVLRAAAAQVRKMHQAHIHHRSLYPKHLFVQLQNPDEPNMATIDLEKSRIRYCIWMAAYYDLATLHRHTKFWTLRHRIYFFKHYLNVNKLTIWHRILGCLIHRRARRD